jgi:hypothetical protein
VSTELSQHGIPRNFLTSEVISAKFRRNSAKFRGIPRNFAGIGPEITSVFRGMPKCHFRGHPRWRVARGARIASVVTDLSAVFAFKCIPNFTICISMAVLPSQHEQLQIGS